MIPDGHQTRSGERFGRSPHCPRLVCAAICGPPNFAPASVVASLEQGLEPFVIGGAKGSPMI
jgi:hypothetical protein